MTLLKCHPCNFSQTCHKANNSKMNRQSCENIQCIQVSTPNSFFPTTFEPGQNDVVIGRGRKCNDHKGNERLRRIVCSRLEEYSAADKESKSDIISSIVDQINMGTPRGAFVKQDLRSRLWFDVGCSAAREKVSRMFRDSLQNNCKLNACSKKNYQLDATYGILLQLMKSRSKDVTKVIEENNQNSEWTQSHSGNPALTNFDADERHEPNKSSESSMSEEDWFSMSQNFIDFTKTDEFQNFDISRTSIHFSVGK